MFLGAAATVGCLFVVPNAIRDDLRHGDPNLAALSWAALALVVVGLIDDRVKLRGRQKLAGQVLAVCILMANGVVIHELGLFGLPPLELGVLAYPFTLFWFLGAINALNLLDGVDGLATTIGIVLTLAIAAMAVLTNHFVVGIVGLAFAGSLAGFLRLNYPPATIFLGDAGSMLIGLVVGALAIEGSLKGPGTVLLSATLAIFAVPILDSSAAILRRKLTGRSIFTGDRGHLHHRLLDRLGNNRRVVAFVAGICVLTSASALVSVFLKNDLVAAITCLTIVTALAATGAFGRAELLLIVSGLGRVVRMLVAMVWSDREAHLVSIHLQGSRHWDMLWEAFTESAEHLGLRAAQLNIDLPIWRETYHALWERTTQDGPEKCWRMEVPLMMAGQAVGRLSFVGDVNEGASCLAMEHLLILVGPFEEKIREMSELEPPKPLMERTVAVVSCASTPEVSESPAVMPAQPR